MYVSASEWKGLNKNPSVYSAPSLARQISKKLNTSQDLQGQLLPPSRLPQSPPIPPHHDENKMPEFIPQVNDQVACLALGEPYPYPDLN